MKNIFQVDNFRSEKFKTFEILLVNKIPKSTKLSNTLTKLIIDGRNDYIPLQFITGFTNLQELTLSLCQMNSLEEFQILQHVNFPQLQILKFGNKCPRNQLLIKFLETNGKNLKEFYTFDK